MIPKNLFLLLGLGVYLFLVLLTAWHRQPPLFDEPFFVANTHLFEKEGLNRQFLVNMQDQAPGPLYEFVHIVFLPLTHLETPGIRLVNVFLLLLTALLTANILSRIRRWPIKESLIYASAIVGVPMIWQVAGMALTEMPAIFFATLALSLLLRTLSIEKSRPWLAAVCATGAGVALGLSILGRSPFLLLVPATFALIWGQWTNLPRWRNLFITNIIAIGLALPVFIVWKGLVPPQQAFVGQGFSVWHGILAFSYAALMTLILAPRWFVFNRRVVLMLLVGYGLFLILNIYIFKFLYGPLDGVLSKLLTPMQMDVFHHMVSPLLALVAVYFFVCTVYRAWLHRKDPVFLCILACAVALLISTGKVTHLFSTRYVAQSAPFFIMLFPDYDRFTSGRLLRICLGVVIGILSLETYFGFH